MELLIKILGTDPGLKIKINKELVEKTVNKTSFLDYCKRYNLTSGNLRSYFCKDEFGKIYSPRWVLEYWRDCEPELFKPYKEKHELTYNHSRDGLKIFERIGIIVYRKNKVLP
ncbi:hypothetical protein ABE096_14025 [Robertmurraya massiliosenegalensis]|uniref:hypothetical protein n=1 Tax=Robertmurraya TaxID=2837507 RepID=UPI0039A6A977